MEVEKKKKSWFKRNWLWFIPVSGCLSFILILTIGLGTLFYKISTLFENTTPMEVLFNSITPVEEIIEQAKGNSNIINFLGENIKTNGIPSGDFNIQDKDGEFDFTVPVIGSKSEGTLIVKGIRANSEWVYEELYIQPKGSDEKIDLLQDF